MTKDKTRRLVLYKQYERRAIRQKSKIVSQSNSLKLDIKSITI